MFRSPKTGFEIAVPTYQVARIEAVARRERTEWYALVVGELLRDDDGVHAVVRDFVPNDWAERGRAHVRLSATAEAKVRELARELHPTLHQLGNLHTHQHFTTEPSTTDRREFWSDPNSVSIIVDPFDSPTIAIYRGREGERLLEAEGDPEPRPRTPAPAAVNPVLAAPQASPVPSYVFAVPTPPAGATDRVDARTVLGAVAFCVVFVGCFAVLDYSIERSVADIAAANALLRERVSALEARGDAARPAERLDDEEDDDSSDWDNEPTP